MVAGLFGQPALGEILRFLSFSLLLESFAQVHNSLLQRELKFRAKMMPEVARGLVKGVLSIGLAMGGFGVWSLVYGHIAGTLVWTTTLMIVHPWRPSQLPKRAMLLTAARYGANMVVGAIINAILRTFDQLLISKVLGPAALGLYALAQRMPQLALRTFGMEANKVLHPVMSQLQPDPASLQRYYYGLVRYFALVIFGLGAILASITSPLIHLIYRPEWHGMIVPMQLLSLAFALGVLNHLPGTVYKAINRSDLFLYIALINLPFAVMILWLVVPYGIEAVALAQIVLVFVLYVPNFVMLRRSIGVEALPTLRAAVPGLLCAAAAAAGGALASFATPDPGLLQLFATTLGAFGAYLLGLWRLGPEVFAEVLRIVGRKLAKMRNRHRQGR